MKKRIIIGLCFCIVSVQARKTDTKELLNSNNTSITLKSILPQSKNFNFKKEIKPSRPQMAKAKKQFSKNDLKKIKDEFKTITYHKDAASLTDKELKKVLDLSLQLGWYDKALFYVDKLLARFKDSVSIENYKLVRADILFEQGSLKSARETYSEFLSLYPGSNHAEYSHYKKTLCAFYQTFASDRDQGPTRDTIKLTESYLEKGDAYKKYTHDIKEIKTHCLALLYENEAHIFEFYLKKRSFKAADKRLAFMKKEFNSIIPESQAHVLQLECRLAYAQGDTARYESRLALLEKRFPHYLNTASRVVAHADKKTDYVSKF